MTQEEKSDMLALRQRGACEVCRRRRVRCHPSHQSRQPPSDRPLPGEGSATIPTADLNGSFSPSPSDLATKSASSEFVLAVRDLPDMIDLDHPEKEELSRVSDKLEQGLTGKPEQSVSFEAAFEHKAFLPKPIAGQTSEDLGSTPLRSPAAQSIPLTALALQEKKRSILELTHCEAPQRPSGNTGSLSFVAESLLTSGPSMVPALTTGPTISSHGPEPDSKRIHLDAPPETDVTKAERGDPEAITEMVASPDETPFEIASAEGLNEFEMMRGTGFPDFDGTAYSASDSASQSPTRGREYVTELVKDLISKLRPLDLDSSVLEHICDRLPALLRAFALKFGFRTQSVFHNNISYFMHKRRL